MYDFMVRFKIKNQRLYELLKKNGLEFLNSEYGAFSDEMEIKLPSGHVLSVLEYYGEAISDMIDMGRIGQWCCNSSISAWLLDFIIAIAQDKQEKELEMLLINIKNEDIDKLDEYIDEAFIEQVAGFDGDVLSSMYSEIVKGGKRIAVELEDGLETELIDEDIDYEDLMDGIDDVMSNGGVGSFIIDNFICEPLTQIFENGKWQDVVLSEEEIGEILEACRRRQKLEGITIAVTGKLKYFNDRDDFANMVKGNGGRVASGVTNKVTCLVTNTPNSNTSKNKKAKELGIDTITEEDFLIKYGLKSYIKEDCDEYDEDEDD